MIGACRSQWRAPKRTSITAPRQRLPSERLDQRIARRNSSTACLPELLRRWILLTGFPLPLTGDFSVLADCGFDC